MIELNSNIYRITRSDLTKKTVLGYVTTMNDIAPTYFHRLWSHWVFHCLQQVKNDGDIFDWDQYLNHGFVPYIVQESRKPGASFCLSELLITPTTEKIIEVDLFVKPQRLFYVTVPIKGYKIYAASGYDKTDAIGNTIIDNAALLQDVNICKCDEPHKWNATLDRPETLRHS